MIVHRNAAEQQILNLIHRYANGVDEGRFDEIAELFGRAQVVMGKQVLTGAIAAGAIEGSLLSHGDAGMTHHAMSNTVIEFHRDGTAASATTRYTVYRGETASGLEMLITGTYLDSFGSTKNLWYFTGREYVLGLLGPQRLHLRDP